MAEVIAEEGISIPFRRLGAPDTAGEVGTVDYLLHRFGMDAAAVTAAAKAMLGCV